jgi:hypothetical protein
MKRLHVEIDKNEIVVEAPEYATSEYPVALEVNSPGAKEFFGLPDIGMPFNMTLRMSREKAVELAHVLLQEALRRG